MKSAVALLLAVAGWMPPSLQADGGAMLLEHHLELRNPAPAVTDYRVDGMYTLHENLRNASSHPWVGLRVELVHQQGNDFVPVGAGESANFMAVEPTAAWRSTVEARIDGHYLGLAGGDWQIERNPAATALEMRFDENPVAPGALLQLRLRVINTHDTTWRLRYIPRLVSAVPG